MRKLIVSRDFLKIYVMNLYIISSYLCWTNYKYPMKRNEDVEFLIYTDDLHHCPTKFHKTRKQLIAVFIPFGISNSMTIVLFPFHQQISEIALKTLNFSNLVSKYHPRWFLYVFGFLKQIANFQFWFSFFHRRYFVFNLNELNFFLI